MEINDLLWSVDRPDTQKLRIEGIDLIMQLTHDMINAVKSDNDIFGQAARRDYEQMLFNKVWDYIERVSKAYNREMDIKKDLTKLIDDLKHQSQEQS